MSRIKWVDLEALEPAARAELVEADARKGGRGLSFIWAHRPATAEAVSVLNRAARTEGTLSPRLLELVRLRIAFHNQCRSCMAIRYADAVSEGFTEELVCSLERPAEADDLTGPERAALHFADLFANNHLAIDESVYDGLREHFEEGELVELGAYCAIAVGIGRLMATWDVVERLPERFGLRDRPVTPWGGDARLID